MVTDKLLKLQERCQRVSGGETCQYPRIKKPKQCGTFTHSHGSSLVGGIKLVLNEALGKK